jgi:hypothetical protein
MVENWIVSLNGTVTVEGQVRFCETGDALAIRFVAASRNRMASPNTLRQMQDSFAELMAHLSECPECDAREFLRKIAEGSSARVSPRSFSASS